MRVSPDDSNSLVFEFFDGTGIGIDKGTERKVENLFFREDFRRTPMDEVGTLDFPSRALERYTGAFAEALAAHALRQANFRVVIDYAFGNASIVLPKILGDLGVEQIALNAYFDAGKVRTFRDDRERHLTQLTTVVTSLEANLGVLIDADGETVTLVDDAGRIVGRNRLMALLTLLVARAQPGARIALPLTVPSVVDADRGRERRDDRAHPQRPPLADEPGRARGQAPGAGRRDELRADLPRVPAGLRRHLRDRQDHGAAGRRAPQALRAGRHDPALARRRADRARARGTARAR